MAGGVKMDNFELLFESSLANEIADFIRFKRSQGYDYKVEATVIKRFDNFLCSEEYSSDILSQDIIDKYLLTKTHLKPATKANNTTVVKLFSQYLNMFKTKSWVCHYTIRVPQQMHYYIYTKSDIKLILTTISNVTTCRTIIPNCITFLIGLLYCTGLRINEALQLQLDDIDFDNQILFVKKGKFRKSRYIALDSTVLVQMKKWLKRRDEYVSELSKNRLFINSNGKKIGDDAVREFFNKIIYKTQIGKDAKTKPRLHDFRHTYACNCINKWREHGDDVNIKLPILSTAMGHVNIQSTQIYLHVTTANLRDASDRFYQKNFNS